MQHLRILCLGCLLMLSQALQAALPAPELQAIRDGSFRITTQYFMYTILEQAGERRNDVNRLITELDARVATLNDKDLLTSWQALRAAALVDPYVKGAVYFLPLYDLDDRVTEFSQVIEKRMPPELSRDKRQLYELAGRMQVMVMVYLRTSADPVSGTNLYSKATSRDLAVLTKEFEALLNTVSAKQQAKLLPVLKKVQPKWIFLKSRLANEQQQDVPYIVDLYGRQIIDLLLVAAGN